MKIAKKQIISKHSQVENKAESQLSIIDFEPLPATLEDNVNKDDIEDNSPQAARTRSLLRIGNELYRHSFKVKEQ